MTQEEALDLLVHGEWIYSLSTGNKEIQELCEAISIVDAALRPVSREQVERMRGEWIVKHDGYEEITITECSKCGDETVYEFFFEEKDSNFCPACGAPMTDEAVDMVMERMEMLHGDL